ncbi:MAG: hypothetical protein QOI89_48 [Solirubrobacteraceae bacterium]|jgi:hypothetical protein|nr:hypothetical protein [Solirubrobacteraceae bacterium]
MPAKPTPASKLSLRRVRSGGGAGYTTRGTRPDGSPTEITEYAGFGDEIAVSAQELARLDALGALAPEGATREDVEEEQRLREEAYRAARRQMIETA